VPADALNLLKGLVAIDSVNPSLVAGGVGEREIAGFIAGWARDSGLEVEALERTPGRPSVVIRARGRGGGRTLLLCGHSDTVSVEGMPDPFTPRLDGDRLHGRGACDMKAGVAVVADEEHSSLGVQEILETVPADAAIVTEPTELTLVVAHNGFVWSEIEIRGRAAHGSRPHLGVDAIAKAGPILTALAHLDGHLEGSHHPLVGRGSVHVSTIHGGEELSTYPARCVIGIERRTLPDETVAAVDAELESLETCRAQDPALEASQRALLVREPFEVGAGYWTDAAFIAAAGIPTILFGPTGEGAHAAEEWVSVSAMDAVTDVLVAVADQLCS
jgi:acetylornithine deacetylase